MQLAKELPQTAQAVRGAEIDWSELGAFFQTALDGAIRSDLAELEKSDIPENVKAAKRQRIRMKGDPDRQRRKSLVLGAVYDAEGAVIQSRIPMPPAPSARSGDQSSKNPL